MIELTQAEYEEVEARILAARDRFLLEIRKYPEVARLYSVMRELEYLGIDARRARRSSEMQEPV